MKIPDATFRRIRDTLWGIADRLNWPTLSDPDKSALYEQWIRDAEVGGVLSRYLDTGNVRVYIKDTIMKPYGRERIKHFAPVLRLLALPLDSKSVEEYIKPHGRRLPDGRVICWGLARDWKAITLAVFERAFLVSNGRPYAAVLMYPSGKYQQPNVRNMIEQASRRLGIETLLWHEP